MLIVRSSFTAKPGKAGQLAAQLKDMAHAGQLRNARVLTDLTGSFNQVVMEHEVASLDELQQLLDRYATDTKMRDAAKGYTELWTTGGREVMKVV